MGRAAVLPHNYPQLQNLIKRDAKSYREEFFQQYEHFKSSLAIVELRPSAGDDQFESLVTFISHVAPFYEESRREFPDTIMDLVSREAASMNPSLRKTLIQCLLLLRKQNLVDLVKLLELFFRLFRMQDKILREFLYQNVVAEIRRANKPHRNNALNKTLQNFMYGLLAESASGRLGEDENLALHKILQIIIELYRRKVWDDARTVNVVAEAAVKGISEKVMTVALNFFIGRFRGKALAASNDSDSDSEEDNAQQHQDLRHRLQLNGSKRSSQKKLQKSRNAMNRKEKKASSGEAKNVSFSAIHLLNDPQGFSEKLFSILKKSNNSFEVKLLLMNVISRVIGAHKLLLLDYYSFLHRYIQPHQKEITHILAYAAQATHDLVPGDVMEPLVVAIAHNFVADHCANEVIAAGLNGLREICSRCPLSMGAELLQDLAHFKGYHDKGVVVAARSLIGLYREVNPELLHRRDRGKIVSMAMKDGKGPKAKTYGTSNVPHLDASHVGRQAPEAGPGSGSGSVSVSEDEDEDEDKDKDDAECQDSISESAEGVSDAEDAFSDGSQVEFSDLDAEENDASEVESEPASGKKDIVSLTAEKIFSREDFQRLRKRMAGAEEESGSEKEADSNASSSGSDSEEGGQNSEIVDPRALESTKRRKQDYDMRMASIQAGREGRLKYGSRKGKHNEKSSVANRVKSKKTKNAIMMVHKSSVRAKKRRSLKERNLSQQKHRMQYKKSR